MHAQPNVLNSLTYNTVLRSHEQESFCEDLIFVDYREETMKVQRSNNNDTPDISQVSFFIQINESWIVFFNNRTQNSLRILSQRFDYSGTWICMKPVDMLESSCIYTT